MKKGRIKLSDEFLLCRLSHSWEEYTEHDMPWPTFGWRYSIRCMRCSTQRHDLIDALGRVASRRYIYPAGYREAAIKGVRLDGFRRELALRRYGKRAVKRSA